MSWVASKQDCAVCLSPFSIYSSSDCTRMTMFFRDCISMQNCALSTKPWLGISAPLKPPKFNSPNSSKYKINFFIPKSPKHFFPLYTYFILKARKDKKYEL